MRRSHTDERDQAIGEGSTPVQVVVTADELLIVHLVSLREQHVCRQNASVLRSPRAICVRNASIAGLGYLSFGGGGVRRSSSDSLSVTFSSYVPFAGSWMPGWAASATVGVRNEPIGAGTLRDERERTLAFTRSGKIAHS